MTSAVTAPSTSSARVEVPSNPRATGRALALLSPIATGAALMVLWALAAQLADSAVFPGPVGSARGLLDDLGRSTFRENVLSTITLLAVSYAAVVVIGVVAGLALGLSRFWSSALLPLVHAVNGIPRIVLFPVFLLILGAGNLSLAGFAFACGVLPMFLIAAESTAAVKVLHLKLAASLGMGLPMLLRRVVVPSILPALVSGMRVAFGLTFVGLLLAELFDARSGIGSEILRAVGQVRMENILGQVVLVAVIALVPTLAMRRLETRATRRYAEGE